MYNMFADDSGVWLEMANDTSQALRVHLNAYRWKTCGIMGKVKLSENKK